jgi:hypothetical protein
MAMRALRLNSYLWLNSHYGCECIKESIMVMNAL